MTYRVLHSRPWIAEQDLASVAATLRSEMIAQGELTQRFEGEFAAWMGSPNPGVATTSGSAAIVLALQALRVGAGDEVVLPSYICPKVLEAVLTVGATPKLCDIGEWWMVEPDNVAPLVGPRTKALLLPHLFGIFVDIAPFRSFGVPIIEDCAQAIADKGSHKVEGDIAIFSFHPTKALTTGEGGMAVSDRAELVAAMRENRDGTTAFSHGRLFAPLSDLAAALGSSQLARYPESLARRRQAASRYRAALEPLLPECFRGFPWDRSMFFRFPLKVRGGVARYQPLFEASGIRVSNAIDALLHRMRGMPDSQFPVSTRLFETTLSLPIYPALSDEDLAYCIEFAVRILGESDARTRTAK